MADGPSQQFHIEFWDAFFGEGMSTIGEALVDSKEDNASDFISRYIRWCGFENNLLGDPAVALKKSLNTTDPLLGIYPPQASFIARLGEPAPAPAAIAVRNDGVGSLSFAATVDQTWVTLTPDSGDAPLDIQIQVDPTGLQPGTHQALITFTSAEAANSPMEMAVVFTLVEVPEIVVPHVQQAPVVDGAINPGEYDQALALAIDSEQAGDVPLYLAVSGTRLHIGVNDMLDPAESEWDRLIVYFDRDLDGLWPPTSADEGMIILTARSGGWMIFMPIYNSGGGAEWDWRGHDRDPPGTEGVIGFIDGHRVYEMSIDLEISRLNVGAAGMFGTFIVVQNSEQMGGGTTTGAWPPVVPEIDDQMFFGRLDMAPGEAWLHASPGDLYFEGIDERDAPNPAILTVSELLGGAVNFTASSSVSWLQVTPTSGQTPLGLTVAADQTGLEPGTHQGEVILESTETGNSQHTVPVTFEVLPQPPRLSVSPLTLEVTVVEGDPDPSTLFTIENIGGMEMDVQLTPSEAWVSTAESFLVQPGTSQNVAVQLSLDGMGVGTYTAEIVVDAGAAEDSPATVAVQLEIQPPNSPPPAPLLMSPENGSELYRPIDLMAYPVTDPDGDPVTYEFEVVNSETEEIVDSGAGVDSGGFISWQPTDLLQSYVVHRWRVKASDDQGAYSYSEERTFWIISEPLSVDCGCVYSRAPSVGFLFLLLGLLVLRLSGRRR
jgi:hypothetical protein